MPTRNVVLTDHNEQFIASLVASGKYQNASEVIRDGLRYIERQKKYEDWLQAEAQIGIDAIERGDYVEFKNPSEIRRYLKNIGEEILRPGSSA